MMNSTRPNHASPWVLDTRPLGRRPGSMKPYRLSAPVGHPMGIEVIAVPTGDEVDLDLRLESVAEGVLVSGTASGTAIGECARCLVEVHFPVTAKLRELYAYPESTTAATTEDDEIPRLIDDLIDLEPLVRDEIVLELPIAPLCRPDCPGLCSECGERFDDLEPGHSHEILDPRWADLAAKFGMPGGSPAGNGRPGTAANAVLQTNGSTRNSGVGESDADSIRDNEEK